MRFFVLSLSLLGLIACGGGDDGGEVAVDAPPAIDAPPPAFVGMWREIPVMTEPEAQRAVLTIGAGHGFDVVDRGTTTRAVWSLESDGRLTVANAGTSVTSPYYVSADRFAQDALIPVGSIDGVVGTWEATMTFDTGVSIDMRMIFEADMSVAYTRVRPGGSDLFEGTWRLEGSNVFLDGTFNGNPSSLFVQVLPGVALGYPLYERLP